MDPISYLRVMSGNPASDAERQQGVDAIRSAASYVLPTSPAEAGAMALFGPFGKAAKLGGLGALLGGYGTEADAGPLSKLLKLFHGGRKFETWDPRTIGSGEGRFLAQGPGLYAGDTEDLAKMYLRYGGSDPALSELTVDGSRIINPAKRIPDELRDSYELATRELDKMGLNASRSGIRNSLLNDRPFDPERVRRALADSGIGGFSQYLNEDFGNEFVIFDPNIIKDITRKYTRGGLV